MTVNDAARDFFKSWFRKDTILSRNSSGSHQRQHLLYDPETLDKWISRTIEPTDQGGYRDAQTGETLAPEDEASYEHYRRRLCERYRTGEQADRLVRIVDRYMPAIADENRTYVMKYPHKVLTMLKQAWKGP